MGQTIRVLVVDDSALVRQILVKELGRHHGIEVVGTAPNPYVARDKIIQLNPDVMTLDIEMPRMDGLTFLRKVMRHRPLPTIVISSLTAQGSAMALDALDAGAVDVLCKPGAAYSMGDVGDVLAEMVRAAFQADMRKISQGVMERTAALSAPIPLALRKTTNKILAIGASTGGTRAIEAILRTLPHNSPGIVVVQHMPVQFTRTFAERLNKLCAIEVKEAQDGDRIVSGLALLAPGNYHMRVVREGGSYIVRLDQGERVHFQRPAVDNLFLSLAQQAGGNVVASLLTGMGKDGAEGMLALRNAGAFTIAQNAETCVVFGMPGEAIRLNAACAVLPLQDIAQSMLEHIEK